MSTSVSVRLPRIVVNSFARYTYLVVILAAVFGGGARQGLWSDAVPQLAALPLLAWAIFRLNGRQLTWTASSSVILLCAMLALLLLQLIPLPPALWVTLPGRKEIVAGYTAAGMALRWLPVSLDPAATWRSLMSLIPGVAVFLAALSLDRRALRVVIALVLVVALASVVIDIMQMMGGSDSPLRFYEITNNERAVGLSANANHHAAFLYCAIPLAVAWTLSYLRDHQIYRIILITLLAVLLCAVIIGLALTHSRAGLGLGFLAGLCVLALVWRQYPGRFGRKLALYGLGANVIALLIAFQFGFVAVAQKVESAEGVESIRLQIARITTQAAIQYFPFGSGFGTFAAVYQMSEPREFLRDVYINHAHDDWIELWLTGGAPAIMLAAFFLAWFAVAAFRAWRGPRIGVHLPDTLLARAASIVIVMLSLHSIVDYPLRTASIDMIFAIACALMIPRPEPRHPQRESAPPPVDLKEESVTNSYRASA